VWTGQTKDRDQWQFVVNTAMKLQVPQMRPNSRLAERTISFLAKSLLSGAGYTLQGASHKLLKEKPLDLCGKTD
jgi:hypothetical protein